MTIDEAVEVMRKLPECVKTMWAVADVWEEAEGFVTCKECRGSGFSHSAYNRCLNCGGSCYVPNGNSLRAEALRLLAECGKTGGWVNAETRYWFPAAMVGDECRIPSRWFDAAKLYDPENAGTAANRVALMDAYAKADPTTRLGWATETRALIARTGN